MVNIKSKSKLKINPEPFKSSYLSIPPSPFSPRTPLALASNPPPLRHATTAKCAPEVTATPPSPTQWLWQCHQCRRTYCLGVTRRCLEDGHHFCAGTTTVKMWRKPLRKGKVRRHRACTSEFDYQGWKTWGRWRRSGRRDSIYDEPLSSDSTSSGSLSEYYIQSEIESGIESDRKTPRLNGLAPDLAKNCWNTCDYPSECRWGKRFGIHTPIATTFPTIETYPTPPPSAPSPASAPPTAATFEGILKPENCKEVKKEKKTQKMDFWGALVASAKRRKNVPPSSPLASMTEESETIPAVAVVHRDSDGDVVMTSFDEALEAPQVAATTCSTTSSSTVFTLKEFVRKGSKKATKSSRAISESEKFEDGTIRGFDFRLSKNEEAEEAKAEFAPLERVRSRKSGYISTPNLS